MIRQHYPRSGARCTGRVGGLFALGASLALLLGCGSDDETAAPACDVDSQKAFVFGVMSDIYLWSDKVPTVDPDDYGSAGELLNAMAYRKVDHWSTLSEKAPFHAYFDQGEAVGFGYQAEFDTKGLRIAWAAQKSPAGRAGLERGMTIVAIAGKSVEDIVSQNLWAEVLGPNEKGAEVVHTIRELDGTTRDIVLEKDVVSLDNVPVIKVLEQDGKKIGYFELRAFIGPAVEELNAAFDTLKKSEVAELIVDLRYNGGGYVAIAGQLASLIGGAPLEGKVLLRNSYNERWTSWNSDMLLTKEKSGLGLKRVIFLTSPNTASASEIVINGLKPFMDVRLVGTKTYGKPVGANNWDHCENVISAVTFRSLNSDGEGDYFGGIPEDCTVPDDLDHKLGDKGEARLKAALDLIRYGSCNYRVVGVQPGLDAVNVERGREQLLKLVGPDGNAMK